MLKNIISKNMIKKLILMIIFLNNIAAMEENCAAQDKDSLFGLLPYELKLHILSFYISDDIIDTKFKDRSESEEKAEKQSEEKFIEKILERIRSHQLVNRDFYLVFSDKAFIKNLISYMHKRFNKSEIETLALLATPASIAWLKENKINVASQDIYEKAFEICQKKELLNSDCIIFKSLLRAGFNVNCKEPVKRDKLNRAMLDAGFTCLMYCSQKGHLRLLASILKMCKPDLNIVNIYGWNALMCAVEAKQKEIVQLWLKAKPNVVNFKRNVGHAETALSLAIANNDEAMVELLLDHKADPNLKAWIDEQTPLHIAIYKNNINIIKILLENGADLYRKNKNGETALGLAQAKNNSDLVQCLVNFTKRS